ncbi:hypothetical protein GMORB2_1703 [Geosmithia morbida]|uniref:Uncharacterized protein n=1 Tax=Geosmithia morbida TaxID=1094350 RepID=A0A9P5CZQ8_9HYPO|nr:uncharacterized protein GMORB2_1703 [Geosmithia morbida]KAF4121863.1 hypothetical protein GMORB2_1703 [Geosmithia morbida]
MLLLSAMITQHQLMKILSDRRRRLQDQDSRQPNRPAAGDLAVVVVQGVEVSSSPSSPEPNVYLPEPLRHSVRGTWAVSQMLGSPDVAALMFVYPRQPDLLTRYIQAANLDVHGGEGNVEALAWLGPTVDWPLFGQCFADQHVERLVGAEAGLQDYEMMAVIRRRR